MGTFNTLIIETSCDNCNQLFEQRIQFRFGEVWQYLYKKGDKIKRGNSRYDIGKPDLPKVYVFGNSENNICQFCSFENPEEVNIIIENDIIKGIDGQADPDRYTEANDYNFYIDE